MPTVPEFCGVEPLDGASEPFEPEPVPDESAVPSFPEVLPDPLPVLLPLLSEPALSPVVPEVEPELGVDPEPEPDVPVPEEPEPDSPEVGAGTLPESFKPLPLFVLPPLPYRLPELPG